MIYPRFSALVRVRFKCFAAILIVAGVLAMIILPVGRAAWLLNQTNAAIARAASLPADSPNRTALLSDAEKNMRAASSHDARFALAKARIEILSGNDAQAIATLRATGNELRGDAIAQFLWAQAEWASGNPAQAVEHWRNAGAIEFYRHAIFRARDAHDWQTMVALARIAIEIEPNDAESRYALGDALASINFADPEAMYQIQNAEALTRDPEFLSTIYSRQGEIFAAQKNFSAAFALFDKAMQTAPLDARPRTDYARTLLQAEPSASDRAQVLLKQSIAIAPWDTLAYITLAEIAEARGDIPGAEIFYRQGLSKNANHPTILFALAQFYARQKRLDDAKQTMVMALRYETHADDLQKITGELKRLNAQ